MCLVHMFISNILSDYETVKIENMKKKIQSQFYDNLHWAIIKPLKLRMFNLKTFAREMGHILKFIIYFQ